MDGFMSKVLSKSFQLHFVVDDSNYFFSENKIWGGVVYWENSMWVWYFTGGISCEKLVKIHDFSRVFHGEVLISNSKQFIHSLFLTCRDIQFDIPNLKKL